MGDTMNRERQRRSRPRPHTNFGMTSPVQWALVLGAAAAAWIVWPDSEPTPLPRSAANTNWYGFLAISYHGICERPGGRNITPRRFRGQIEALAGAGYQPITIEEAHRFILEDAPLPEKAVLLLFEDGRRDTSRAAEEVLRELRFPATMLLRLEPIERSDHFFVSWHALRNLAATGRWSFGTKGLNAPSRVRTHGVANEGSYLTSRILLDDGARLESEAEWRQRVVREVEASARILERRIPGWKPTVFAFPDGNAGESMLDQGLELRRIVSETFPLAFSRSGYAWNHRGSSPDRLTRLFVSPGWAGGELLRRLEAHGARQRGFSMKSDRDWVLRHGHVAANPTGIVLEPETGRGAEAWLAGSEHWRCVRGKVIVETRPDVQTWLYLRATPGKSYIRLGWSGKSIELQSRVGGGRIQRLARGRPPEHSPEAFLSIDLRSRHIRFAVEGGEAPERSFPTPAELDAGMAGLGIWHLGEEREPVAFRGLELEPRVPNAVLVNDVEEARRSLETIVDVLAPQWYRVEPDGDEIRLRGDSDQAMVHLAAYHGASLWPVVRLGDLPSVTPMSALVAGIDRVRADTGAGGVLLDLRPAAARPLETQQLRELLVSTSTPIGVISHQNPAGATLSYPGETTIAWLSASNAEDAMKQVPPERRLLLREPPR